MGLGWREAAALGRVPVEAATGAPAAAARLPKEQGQGSGALLPASLVVANRFLGAKPPEHLHRLLLRDAATHCPREKFS